MSKPKYPWMLKLVILQYLSCFLRVSGVKIEVTLAHREDSFTNPYARSCQDSGNDWFCRGSNATCFADKPKPKEKCCLCKCDVQQSFDLRKLTCVGNVELRKGKPNTSPDRGNLLNSYVR